MASKQIKDSLSEARNALDQDESLGKIAYDICDGVLNNNKAFIHEDVVWKKINEHEEKVHKEFTKRLIEAREKLKNSDPIFAWNDGMNFYMKLREWKSLEMLNFWDKLSKEHDI